MERETIFLTIFLGAITYKLLLLNLRIFNEKKCEIKQLGKYVSYGIIINIMIEIWNLLYLVRVINFNFVL
jgi:hypothetical protein